MTTVLFSSGDWDGHGAFWLWPLIPLFWLLVFFLLARFVFWRRRGPSERERRTRPTRNRRRALRPRRDQR